MDLNTLRESVQMVGAAVALLLGGTQLWDRRRSQAVQVHASRERVNGRWHSITRNPSKAPVDRVLLIFSDDEHPLWFAPLHQGMIPAENEVKCDLQKHFTSVVRWSLPLSALYFTDAHGRHWRRANGKVRRQRRSIYDLGDVELEQELERRLGHRPSTGRSVSGTKLSPKPVGHTLRPSQGSRSSCP